MRPLTVPRTWRAELSSRVPDAIQNGGLSALGLDAGGRVVQTYRVALGALNTYAVEAEHVFGPAVRSRKVAGIVLVSSQPSGKLAPTATDLAETRRLRREGDLAGVRLVDHLLVGPRKAVSLRAAGG